MKIIKTLKPIALALPGLLATCAHGGFAQLYLNAAPSTEYSADGSATTGYTEAEYSGDAVSTLYRLIQGKDVSLGWVGITQDSMNNVSYLQATYTWSSVTYTRGESNVNNQGYALRPGSSFLPDVPNGVDAADSFVGPTGGVSN